MKQKRQGRLLYRAWLCWNPGCRKHLAFSVLDLEAMKKICSQIVPVEIRLDSNPERAAMTALIGC